MRSPINPERTGESQLGEVEYRLSNVERKLDLILKALEARGGEPAKE